MPTDFASLLQPLCRENNVCDVQKWTQFQESNAKMKSFIIT